MRIIKDLFPQNTITSKDFIVCPLKKRKKIIIRFLIDIKNLNIQQT